MLPDDMQGLACPVQFGDPHNALFDGLGEILSAARTIAVVGAKDKPGTAVDMVGRYLIAAGYSVVPVHPVRQNVWGLPTYSTLADIPFSVDIINLFRASEHCPAHAGEVLDLAVLPALFWMQSGIQSAVAREMLVPRGVRVVEDRCLMVDHRRLLR